MSNIDNKNNKNNIKGISYGGIIVALILSLMYLSSIIRVNKISLLFISSVLLAVLIFRHGVKFGALAYVASTVLGLALIPDKTVVIIFAVFSGLYPIIKLYIERIRNMGIEILLKLLYLLTVTIGVYYFISSNIVNLESIGQEVARVNEVLSSNNALYIIGFTGLALIFFIYDIMLSKVTYLVVDKVRNY